MNYEYKNPVEHPSGLINCEILVNNKWKSHTMASDNEYELHESSEWKEIKPCSEAEKELYIKQKDRDQFKMQRAQAMQSLTVTTASGNVFDADETSQTRMSRAITIMDDVETTVWVLADNTPIQAAKAELKEALRLAGEAQAALWVQQ